MMYLVAFALSYVLVRYQVKERRLEVEEGTVTDLFFWAILGLLIGGRLFAVLIFDESGYYWRHPLRIFWPFDESSTFVGIQGMNYYGGVVGATVAVVLFTRRKKLDLLEWGDMMTAAIPLGYTFGRIGNFINGELYGRVTTAPWGVLFPNAKRLPVTETWVVETARTVGIPIDGGAEFINLPRHPTQLYEAATEGVIAWLIMWFVFRPRRPFRGFFIAFYIFTYGFFRFIIDYFRMPLGSDYLIRFAGDPSIPPDRLVTPWNFIASQVWSFGMLVGGVLLMYAFYRLEQRRTAVPADRAAETRPSGSQRRKIRKRLRG
jgi:phosphatidylglycerol:prolipoprotein diacylglycerol transferase